MKGIPENFNRNSPGFVFIHAKMDDSLISSQIIEQKREIF